MNTVSESVLTLCCAAIVGCASGEPDYREREPDVRDIARAIGCGPKQVAVCVDAHCELDEYRCADEDDVRGLFESNRRR